LFKLEQIPFGPKDGKAIARGIAGKLCRKVSETVGPTDSLVFWFLARNFVARLRTREPKEDASDRFDYRPVWPRMPQLVIGKAGFFASNDGARRACI